MKLIRTAAICSVFAFSASAFAQDKVSVDPGMYKMDMVATSSGATIVQDSTTECVEAGENSLTFAEMQEVIGDDTDCTFSNVRKSPGKIVSDASCKLIGMDATLNGVTDLDYESQKIDLLFDGTMTSGGMNLPFEFKINLYRTSATCS